MLDEQNSHGFFDVDVYRTRIMTALKPNDGKKPRRFSGVASGIEYFDVSRWFITCLQLASEQVFEIDQEQDDLIITVNVL